MAFGTQPTPTGLAEPPIDDLMEHADSSTLLLFSQPSALARSIPISPSSTRACCRTSVRWWSIRIRKKPLSIAFREINDGLLEETLGEDDLTEGN